MSYTTIPPNGVGDAAGIGLLVCSIVSLKLAAISIALRVWVRRINHKALAFNDWLLFIAWFFSLALTINIILFVGWSGLGQQEINVSPDSVVLTFQLLPAAESLWATANTATKVSILLVYKDIFSLRKFRIIADVVITIVIMLGVGNIIQCLAICRPFAFQWDKTIPGGVCGNQNLGILLVACLNLMTDLMIVIMPMPMLWKLKMPQTKRLALMGMFGLGIIICIITILRIVFTLVLIRNETNSTYWIAINALFLTLEPNLGMVNACLLLLKPLLERLRPKLRWGSNNQSNQEYPLSSPPQNHRPSKLLPARYGIKYGGDTDDSIGTFTLLDDSQEVVGEVPPESVKDGNRISDLTFGHQENEVTVGQRDDLFPRGIMVTKTMDVESSSIMYIC